MRKLSVPELECLKTALLGQKRDLQHVMRYHLGGYTKERKESLDLTEKLLEEVKSSLV